MTATAQPGVRFDPRALRAGFPILARRVHGRPLVYLDNAATTQKPATVLAALASYYTSSNANVHRGVHTLAEEATALYELCRARTARFVNAPDARGVVIVRNATEAINLVARSWGATLSPGDEVLLSEMEHHSNLVPWIMLARERGVTLRHVPITGDGRLDMAALASLLSSRTRVVSLTAPSRSRTCRLTSRRLAPTSWRSPPTRCTARPESGSWWRGPSCSSAWSRSAAAVR